MNNVSSKTTESMHIGYVIERMIGPMPPSESRQYRGVNRLPNVPDPTLPQDENIKDAWSRYLDAWEVGQIGRDLFLAQTLADDLTAAGEPAEIVYVDLVVGPPRLMNLPDERRNSFRWLETRCAGIGLRPPSFVRLGLDVAVPVPDYHSALRQPGLIHDRGRLHGGTNDWGLLDNLDVATAIMREANSTGYLLSMFSVLEVFAAP
jgi:hypothetical protein